MQQMMTRWIEAADERAVWEQEMSRQMLAGPVAPEPSRSLLATLRLQLLSEPVNRCFRLGSPARPSH
jgi:hypothetical protein